MVRALLIRQSCIQEFGPLVTLATLDHIDIAIVGAGVVGLAIARSLAQAGREVWVLEAAGMVGSETSSRNSEVIHAGIYYPQGSLKARLCTEGRPRLYRYCSDRGIAHRAIGKLIVATNEGEAAILSGIRQAAIANGVTDLEIINKQRIETLEPAVRAIAGLYSPSTGIIDSHALMQAYQADAEAAGATVVCRTPVIGGALDGKGLVLGTGGNTPMALRCRMLINAAGLGAPALAGSIAGFPSGKIPPSYLCKGSYFSLSQANPFHHLVYPVPEPGGLGVHLTLDLGGQARFGPDVEWVETIDYAVDPARAERFYPAIRRYWPDLREGALVPAYSGIRPKITGPTMPAADFRIDGRNFHGVPQIINLYGIESPGLTASLAIADYVSSLVLGV